MGGRKKWVMRLLCLCMVLMLFPMVDETVEAKQQTIRIAYCDYENFIVERNGNYSGYAVDYLGKISEYTGWKYEYVYDSWENCLNLLRNGEVDLIVQAQYTKERAKEFIYSKTEIGHETGELYARVEDDRFYFEDYEAFDGMVIGQMKDNFQNIVFEEYAKKSGFEYETVEFDTMTEAFHALECLKVDAVVTGGLAVKKGYKLIAEYSSDPFYAITTKDKRALIEEFDNAAKTILNTDPYYEMELYKTYYEMQYIGSIPNFTREEMAYIKNSDVITIGQMNNGLPFCQEMDDEIVGVQQEIVKKIEKLSGLRFRSVMAVPSQEEKIDLYCGMFLSSGIKVKEGYSTSKSIYPLGFRLIEKQGSFIPLDEEIKIGVLDQNGFVYYDYMQEFPQGEFVTYHSIGECMDALEKEEIDYAFLEESMASIYININNKEHLSILNTYNKNGGLYFIFDNNTDQILISIINKCILRIDKEELTNIASNYSFKANDQISVKAFLIKYRMQIIILGLLLAFVFYLLIMLNMNRKEQERQLIEYNNSLQENNRRLEQASLAKTEFLSNMSHEIRTPMNAIMGITSLLENEMQKEEKDLGKVFDEYIKDIKLSSKYLLDIINNILDMNRIESGKINLMPEWISPKQIVENCVRMMQLQMKEKDIEFSYQSDFEQEDMVEYFLDRTRTQQIVMNLLNNAYKFTGENGKVSFMVHTSHQENGYGQDELIVSDTGCGMSEEFLGKIFKPFEQERNPYSDLYPGSGLGLALVKKIVEQMGGDISVESKLGEGSVFRILIPYQYRLVTKKERTEKKYTQEEIDRILDGKKVLLVEDQELNRKIAEKILSNKKIQVDYAQNGAVAVELFANAKEGEYDAILMDIRMPVMSGLEATRQIRALFKNDALKVPIIAMTANAFLEDINDCMRAGMNAHLAKPIHPDDLFKTLAKFMS